MSQCFVEDEFSFHICRSSIILHLIVPLLNHTQQKQVTNWNPVFADLLEEVSIFVLTLTHIRIHI